MSVWFIHHNVRIHPVDDNPRKLTARTRLARQQFTPVLRIPFIRVFRNVTLKMNICMATCFSIALLLGNSVKLRASVTGPVPSHGESRASDEACPMCSQRPAGIPGIPGVPGYPGCKGNAGQKGDMGPTGPMGDQGAVGNPGPKGEIGPTGHAGVKGPKGEPGETPDDSNQRVAFTVVRTSPSYTSSNDDTDLPFQETKTLLPGTNFDLDTGTFTCTVPGTYVFMFSATKNPSSNLHVHLRKNGDAVVSGLSNDGSPYEQVSGSGVLVLQQGDKVYLTIYGRAFSESAYPWTSFSGFLLYPE